MRTSSSELFYFQRRTELELAKAARQEEMKKKTSLRSSVAVEASPFLVCDVSYIIDLVALSHSKIFSSDQEDSNRRVER